MHKKGWRIVAIIVGVILIAWIGIKVAIQMEEQKEVRQHQEMIETVKSPEVQHILRKGIKDFEPTAFTQKGVIQSYKIDWSTVEHNPMGGIDGTITFNHDKKLQADFNLDKDSYGDYDDDVFHTFSGKIWDEVKKDHD